MTKHKKISTSLFTGTFILLAICCDSVAGIGSGVRLTDSSTDGEIHITGKVVLPPPCTVNNDKPVNVEFGNVRTDLIDGSSYDIQPIPLTVTCTANPSDQLQLSLQGISFGENTAALVTSTAGLGLMIRLNHAPLDINSWVNITNGDEFDLIAVPIKMAGKKLETGEFTATATLVIRQE